MEESIGRSGVNFDPYRRADCRIASPQFVVVISDPEKRSGYSSVIETGVIEEDQGQAIQHLSRMGGDNRLHALLAYSHAH